MSITPASKWWSILRKEDKTMTYTKPEVALLGDARTVIENLSTVKGRNKADAAIPHLPTAVAAYDLDE
jgi:hypothetical protein